MSKKVLVIAAVLIMAGGLFAQDIDWAIPGDDIYTGVKGDPACVKGNVGIGTNNPDEKLHVEGNVKITDDGGRPCIDLVNDPTTKFDARIQLRGDDNLSIQGAQVGIGLMNPNADLHVKGQVKIADGTEGAGKVLTSDATGLGSWQDVSGDITAVTAGNGLFGGGESGDVTLEVLAGVGIIVDTDFIGLDESHTDFLYVNEGQPNSITAGMIAADAVTTTTIADGSVTTAELSPSGSIAGQVLTSTGGAVQWQDPAGGGGAGNRWKLTGNAGTIPGTNFLGTTDNQPLEIMVNGQRALRIEPRDYCPNIMIGDFGMINQDVFGATMSGGEQHQIMDCYGTIGGGYHNEIWGEYCTIGGGMSNNVNGNFATIGGGQSNGAGASYSTVGGGQSNNASGKWAIVNGGYGNKANLEGSTVGGGKLNTAENYSTIGGGSTNEAKGDASTVGGGYLNKAIGRWSTVAGGQNNQANTVDWATISGGADNKAVGHCSVICGGARNEARLYSTVGGGRDNYADNHSTIGGGAENKASVDASTIGGGFRNEAKGHYPTVGGGCDNHAINDYATIGGGSKNYVSGAYATVPGGASNLAQGAYSFAAGRRARAYHDGSFVWGDCTDRDFYDLEPNEFRVRASGGITLYTHPLGSSGVEIPSGSSSWSSICDRELKENFSEVDGTEILTKIAEMPIQTWNYKSQDVSIRHIGPVSQDFYSAFGVGEDDKHISTVDADGVALAAIQALYKENQELKSQVEDLTKRLEALENASQ